MLAVHQLVGEPEHLKLFPNNMKKNNLQNKKGLALRNLKGISLVETIVYVAIFSLFVIGLAQFSTTLSTTRLHTQGVLEVNDQGSRAIKLITQTLRGADSVNSPSVGNSASTLNLSVEAIPGNTTFSESGGVLYTNEGPGAPIVLTNNKVVVSNLEFFNLSRAGTPNIIKVRFTLTSADARDPYTVNFEGSGALRK